MIDTDPSARRPQPVRFAPGEAVGIVGPDAVCLVADHPGSALVAELRANVLDGGTESPLEVMVRTGGLDLPPFGLALVDGAQVRVVVRGGVVATIQTADGLVEVRADRVRTWVEHVADDAGAVRLEVEVDGVLRAGDPVFETVAGVVPVDLVEIELAAAAGPRPSSTGSDTTVVDPTGDGGAASQPVGDDEHDAPIPPPFVEAESVPASVGFGIEPGSLDAEVVVASADDPVSTGVPVSTGDPASPPDDGQPVAVETSLVDPAEPTRWEPEWAVLAEDAESVEAGDESAVEYESGGVEDAVPVADESGGVEDDPVGSPDPIPPTVDHGATLIGPFDRSDDDPDDADEDSMVSFPTSGVGELHLDTDASATSGSPGEDGVDDDYDHLFGATQFRTVEQAAVRPEEEHADHDGAESAAAGGAMISAIPGSGAAPQPDIDDGDHDGRTVSLASLRAQLEGSAPTPGTSPSVHAVHCPRGHLNPTHAGLCRVCGDPIGDQQHVSVPRPVLGSLTFSDGRVVEVSRPLLIGRSPKADGVLSGEPPELVVVPSPLKEISSTHLELRLEGWQVLVVDRQSTNGTVVISPGRDPQRLRPGEPVPIMPGTRVNLADETEFVFEVAP